MPRNIERIEGEITFADGETVRFLIGADGSMRWGNSADVIGDAVDPCEAMANAVADFLSEE